MIGIGEKTLILNPGSSSLKFRLYSGDSCLQEGEEEVHNNNEYQKACKTILDKIKEDVKEIKKVAYRVVHGGDMTSPCEINQKVIKKIKDLSPLAPLHMGPALGVINFFMRNIKGKHFACFDTSFHKTIPEYASRYTLPLSLTQKYQIKRYGFHGLAHGSMFKEIEKVTKKRHQRIISCQLGNGSSICAIKNGKSIDTSMGFTPLEGVMMGTRSGSIDPAIISFLNKKGMKNEKIFDMLEKESGLKAISGTNDIRKILELEKRGDKKASLALEMYSYQIRKYVGSYLATLGGVDLIVLGGGISRSPRMRIKILEGLNELGILLDYPAVQKDASSHPIKISKGKVEVWAIETDEQKYMFELIKNL